MSIYDQEINMENIETGLIDETSVWRRIIPAIQRRALELCVLRGIAAEEYEKAVKGFHLIEKPKKRSRRRMCEILELTTAFFGYENFELLLDDNAFEDEEIEFVKKLEKETENGLSWEKQGVMGSAFVIMRPSVFSGKKCQISLTRTQLVIRPQMSSKNCQMIVLTGSAYVKGRLADEVENLYEQICRDTGSDHIYW